MVFTVLPNHTLSMSDVNMCPHRVCVCVSERCNFRLFAEMPCDHKVNEISDAMRTGIKPKLTEDGTGAT